MSNRFYAILIGAVAAVFLLWNATFVVNEREQAVVLRFGEITRTISDPGLYFKLPFGFLGADRVTTLPDRLLRLDLDDIRVQVSGGKFYEVDAFLVYEIADAAQFLRSVSGSIQQAEQRLRTRLDAALRRVYGLRGFEAALSEERSEMMHEVAEQIRPDAESLGVALADVRIRRTDLTDEVSEQTYERMRAERLAEAELLRARGAEAASRIRAAADRQVTEIIAAAQRDAEILRGQGDAQRSAIYAEAFGRNPEFFAFYRSLEAYEAALEDSDATMVLSPDSEFFRYFQSDGLQITEAAGVPEAEAEEPSADVTVQQVPLGDGAEADEAGQPAPAPEASSDVPPAATVPPTGQAEGLTALEPFETELQAGPEDAAAPAAGGEPDVSASGSTVAQ